MKKKKLFEVSLINKTHSKPLLDWVKFYTSDTALELGFQLLEVEHNFDSAEILLLNDNDRSFVTRTANKTADGFTYEIEDDIVTHYGEWKAQLKFEKGDEVYVSSPVVFRIENDLSNDRPPQLTDVNNWETLRRNASELIAEMGDIVANETARIEAEKQRNETVKNIEARQNTVENQFISVQEELTDKDVISAPEIITARGDEPTLSARLDKEQQEVTAQLADIVQQIPKQIIPTSKLQKIKNKLSPPTNFVWKDAPINIYKSGDGTITTDLDASTFKHVGAGKVYYVNVNTGNNANDGLTPETALKSIYVARLKSDVDIIEVADGFYDDSNGFNNINASSSFKNLTIRSAIGADVTISTARKLTWTKTVGKTNVYQTTRSLFVSVWDSTNLDANGDYINLISVASIDLCDTTPNSYYYDGSILYVHTYNSRVADTNLLVFLDLYNFSSNGNYRIYFENIKFYGGKNGCIGVSNTENGALVVAKNCEFKYSSAGSGGVTTLGYDTIMQNCICAKNYADGFNYHKNGLKLCNSIEVDCIGRSNGLGRGTDTDNGSTTHDGCKIIRINGNYHSNEGPNVHDIFTGTESWNVGCESHDSKGIASNRNANYFSEDNAKVFLEDCIGYDSIRAFYIASTGLMYQRNCLFDDGLQSNNGVLESF